MHDYYQAHEKTHHKYKETVLGSKASKPTKEFVNLKKSIKPE